MLPINTSYNMIDERVGLPLKTDVNGNVLLGTMDFDFDQVMDRIETRHVFSGEYDVLRRIPYEDLVSQSWLEAEKDEYAKILNLRHFFCVDSLWEIKLTQQVAFRQSKEKNIDQYALAAWLRKGEIESIDIELPNFCRSKLENVIPQIRGIAYEMPDDFFARFVNVLHGAGVGLIAVKNPKNTAVNGAARKIFGKPIIQMSIYKRRLDILLFSLFHEIGHILLHDIDNQGYISLQKAEKAPDDIDADNFAAETLLKSRWFDEFAAKRDFSLSAVNKFSKQMQVHPGIVMGRLEYKKKVHPSVYAKHHVKLAWGNEQ